MSVYTCDSSDYFSFSQQHSLDLSLLQTTLTSPFLFSHSKGLKKSNYKQIVGSNIPLELRGKNPSPPSPLNFSHSSNLFWKGSQSFFLKADVHRCVQQGRQRIPTEEQGRGVCIPVILLEGENEGGRVG